MQTCPQASSHRGSEVIKLQPHSNNHAHAHPHALMPQQPPHMSATARVNFTGKREESPASMQSGRSAGSDRSSEATSTSNGRSTNDTGNGNGSSSTSHPHGTVSWSLRFFGVCTYLTACMREGTCTSRFLRPVIHAWVQQDCPSFYACTCFCCL
jgi:hypothetical protein